MNSDSDFDFCKPGPIVLCIIIFIIIIIMSSGDTVGNFKGKRVLLDVKHCKGGSVDLYLQG